MQRRIAQLLVPVVTLSLGACSGLTRWDAPPRHAQASQAKSNATAPATSRPAGTGEYTVRSGDTLYSIAFRNQLDYHDLARWNGIGAGYRIMPGQVLRLKPGAGAPGAKPAAPRQSETVVAASPAVPPAAPATPQATVPAVPVAPASEPAIEGGFEWLWPTTGTIVKTYAPQNGFKGLDFGGNLGQPVFAAAPGRVVYSGNALKGYGELIIIKHNETYLSAYSYNRRRNVSEGDVVTAGQPIGELGLGPESKPFLHFEIRERGQPVDPMRFLPKRETTPGAK
jgi:lipoprotein NlpD